MKNIKFLIALLLVFIIGLSFGCGENQENENGGNNQITEDSKTKTLDISNVKDINVGDTLSLVALYDQGAKVDLSWTIDNENIASIDNTGKITTLSEGKIKVTLVDKESNLKKEYEINITKKVKELTEEEIEELIKSLPKQTVTNLPTEVDGVDIEYQFDSGITNDGKITRDEDNQEVTGKVIINGNAYDYKVTIVGEFIDDIAREFISQFRNINGDLEVKKNYTDFGGTYVQWECEDDIVNKNGKYTRPFNDRYVKITYTVISKNPSARAKYEETVLAVGETIETRNKTIEEWINRTAKENSVLYVDSVLPTYCDDYEATIQWFDYKGDELDISKYADDPVLGKTAVFTVRVTYPNTTRYIDFTMDYRVWNKRYNNTQGKVEDFLDALHLDKIRSYVYWSQGYDEVNMGYVPFYDSHDAVINYDYMCEYTYGYVCTGILKKSTEYITVHDTAGALPTHTALQFAQGQVQKNTNKSNTEYISWHFTVGNDGIYQSLPLDEVAYHAGDGSREYGTIWYSSTYNKADCIGGGNRNSVGIESCINHGSDYNDTMRMLAKLVSELLLHYNLSVDRVKQHWHFSGKDCPGVIRHCQRWEEFLDLVRLEYFAKTELKDVEFVWTSLVPEILDDKGHVIKSDGNEFDISYRVKYTIDGKSFEKDYTSTVLAQGSYKLGDW